MGGIIGGGFDIYSSVENANIQKRQASETEYESHAQAELLRQEAEDARTQAGIEQVKGEREAEERSRRLSAEIGSLYTNWAGNGLSVSGTPSDTFGDVLTTQVAEGMSDIATIKDNAAMNVWSYQSRANTLRNRAALTEYLGYQKADILRESSSVSRVAGIGGGIGTMFGGAASLDR